MLNCTGLENLLNKHITYAQYIKTISGDGKLQSEIKSFILSEIFISTEGKSLGKV